MSLPLRKPLLVLCGLLACALASPSTAAAATVPGLLDFEDFPADTPIFDQYDGVTFVGGDLSPAAVQVVVPELGTVSGTQALRYYYAEEFAGSALRIRFAEGQRRIALSVGIAQSPFNQTDLSAVLRGYDSAGNLLVESPIVLLGDPPRAVQTPFEIASATGDIAEVELELLFTDGTDVFARDGAAILIDNLAYQAPTDPDPVDATAPLVQITLPNEGDTVQGPTPGAFDMRLEGAIVEDSLALLTLAVNGAVAQPMSHSFRQNGAYPFLASLYDSSGLLEGTNTVVIEATDIAGNIGSATRSFNYRSPPVAPSTDVDIVPFAIEVNQGISAGPRTLLGPNTADGFETSFPHYVPLVASKPTVVRAFAIAQGSTGSIPNVPAQLYAYRADCTSNCRLGELVALDENRMPSTGITVQAAGDATATAAAQASDLAASWNFLIPAAWTGENLRLELDINFGSNPAPECKAEFLAECERGNRVTVNLAFAPEKTVTVNPILVTLQGNGGGTTNMGDVARMLEGLNTLYPTDFVLGPVRSTTASAGLDDGELLDTIQSRFGCLAPSLWSPSSWWACGYDPEVFNIALVRGGTNLRWGGLANRGNNTVWSRPNRVTPSHEVGHAMGFMHATCDHNEASGGSCDSYYPGEHGRLQGLGFDITNWALVQETPAAHPHDFMSYGGSRWVSRAMWEITQADPKVDSVDYAWCQMPGGFGGELCGVRQGDRPAAQAVDSPVLVVRGRIGEHGLAEFDDAYELPFGGLVRTPQRPTPYLLEGRDEAGNTLFFTPLWTQQLSDPSAGWVESFSTQIELPPGSSALAQLDLLEDWNVVGSLAARGTSAPTVSVTPLGAGTSWARDEVRVLEWSVAGGAADLTAQVELAPSETGLPGRVLATQLSGTSLAIPVTNLPSGSEYRLVVRVSDGLHTGVSASAPFDIEPAAPSVLITQPTEDIVVSEGSLLSLRGMASDDRSALPGTALAWSSNLDGDLGSGAQLANTSLSVGVHSLTLTATSEQGIASEVSVQVTVEAPPSASDGSDEGCGCASGGGPSADCGSCSASWGSHADASAAPGGLR